MRPRLLRLACQIIPGNSDGGFHPARLCIWQDCAAQQAHAGRFTGAIRSNQPIDFAWRNLHANPIYCPQVAITPPELIRFDEQIQVMPP